MEGQAVYIGAEPGRLRRTGERVGGISAGSVFLGKIEGQAVYIGAGPVFRQKREGQVVHIGVEPVCLREREGRVAHIDAGSARQGFAESWGRCL